MAFTSLVGDGQARRGSNDPIDQQSSVVGHAGELVLGTLEGIPVMCMKGRGQVIAHFVHSILNVPALPATFDEVRPLLLPALRRKSLLDYIQREAPAGTPNVSGYVHRDVGPDIVLVLAIDAEQTISLVMDATFNGWDVTFEQALAVTMDNLRDRSADNFMPFDGVPGLVLGNWNDGYDSSRILLPDLMYRGESGSGA